MSEQTSTGGKVLRGADGSIYFIRNEVLEACKQPAEIARQLEQLMAAENEVQGFSIDTSRDLQAIGSVNGPMAGASMSAAATLMCPSLWVTK